MNIFLSWSGEQSKKLATAFHEWLPLVLQTVNPYMSSKDINLGTRWNEDINKKLEESSMGLIFVTPENIESSWLNFESGALSNSLGIDHKVIPIVFGEKEPDVLLSKGPLKQFQSVMKPDKNNFYELVKTINCECENSLSDENLSKTFKIWWDNLDEQLLSIQKRSGENKRVKKDDNSLDTINNSLLYDLSYKVDQLTLRTNQLIHNDSDDQNLIDNSEECLRELKRADALINNYLNENVSPIKDIESLMRARKSIQFVEKYFRYLTKHNNTWKVKNAKLIR